MSPVSSISQGESPADSRVAMLIAGTLIPTILGSIFALARLFTRAVIIKNWGPDDTLIAIAWIISIIIAILNCSLTKFGVGHHAFTIPLPEARKVQQIVMPAQLLYQLTLFITKMGICLFYRRIFQDKWSRKLVHILITCLTLEIIAAEAMMLLRCIPFLEFFNPLTTKCASALPVLYLNGLFNILADLLLIGFAVPRLLPLQMPRRQKIPLLGIVSLGFLAVTAAAVRLYIYVKQNDSRDFPYTGVEIPIWSSIEISTGIFCASAPCLRPLLRKITPGFLNSSSRTNASDAPTSGIMETYESRKNRTTIKSRVGLDDIEMQSSNNLTNMDTKHERETVIWTGKGDSASSTRDLSDDESQLQVLRSDGIVKTISVKITNRDRTDTSDVGRQRQAEKYEHI